MKDEEKKDKGQNPTLKKNAMLQALEKSLGVVTTACNKVGLHRSTHYEWLNTDPWYKEQVEDLANVTLDFMESQLHKRISKGDTTAIIFGLKTKGKSRGYIEQMDFSGTVKTENVLKKMTTEQLEEELRKIKEVD